MQLRLAQSGLEGFDERGDLAQLDLEEACLKDEFVALVELVGAETEADRVGGRFVVGGEGRCGEGEGGGGDGCCGGGGGGFAAVTIKGVSCVWSH